VGWKGNEFYVPCESTEDFFIDCGPPYGDRRSCTEYVFLGREINAGLSFQHRILKDHKAIVEAIRKLVFSFVRPITNDSPNTDDAAVQEAGVPIWATRRSGT